MNDEPRERPNLNSKVHPRSKRRPHAREGAHAQVGAEVQEVQDGEAGAEAAEAAHGERGPGLFGGSFTTRTGRVSALKEFGATLSGLQSELVKSLSQLMFIEIEVDSVMKEISFEMSAERTLKN